MTLHRLAAALCAACLLCLGCNRTAPPAPAAATPAPTPAVSNATTEAYSPGLGEIMTLQQMRHTKLWFSGEAGNWALADYELKELGEGFDDIVKFHPTHDESPVAPKDAIPRMIPGPLKDLQTAVDAKDKKGFETAYDTLTTACNDCHKATNFGFNRLQRPSANPYADQVFTAAKD